MRFQACLGSKHVSGGSFNGCLTFRASNTSMPIGGICRVAEVRFWSLDMRLTGF